MSNNNLEKVDFSSMTKEEVIAYFKSKNAKLEQKNSKLKEENKELKAENKKLERKLDTIISVTIDSVNNINKGNLQIFTPLKKPSLDPTIMPCLSGAQAGTLREQVS